MKPKAYSYIRFSDRNKSRAILSHVRKKCPSNIVKKTTYPWIHLFRYMILGISAFKGKNSEQGALGAFLDAIDKGNILRL